MSLLGNITYKPAQILGIEAGTLAEGSTADVCIFDPNKRWTLNEENMHSLGQNSPFLGQIVYTR
ncbi:hypothetical protein PN36_13340 [Candidatus Thiomargarita nelsonii]|uniref:Uncharacterized protein n=1 Tax=Candidatus Thiomargarita nelsonii TaxID=1003181 RepID=A0A4E0QPF0_9GAMM|nr:hypothetical protein PN36_13340 [Candidatus Thiomargarita nelsonii]